jgi:hypothetical protein
MKTVPEDIILKPEFRRPDCDHASVIPTYADADFEGLSAGEVRARFPRFHGACPDCGCQLIGYSSYAHCIAGDW